jgi:hypothetical protein
MITILFDCLPPELQAAAVSLPHFGLRDHAWTKADIDAVLLFCLHNGLVILGGDVLSDQAGRLNHTGDNWYARDHELTPQQSYDRTRAYVDLIRRNVPDEERYFVVVVRKTDQSP